MSFSCTTVHRVVGRAIQRDISMKAQNGHSNRTNCWTGTWDGYLYCKERMRSRMTIYPRLMDLDLTLIGGQTHFFSESCTWDRDHMCFNCRELGICQCRMSQNRTPSPAFASEKVAPACKKNRASSALAGEHNLRRHKLKWHIVYWPTAFVEVPLTVGL
jgi:hypothetical protein